MPIALQGITNAAAHSTAIASRVTLYPCFCPIDYVGGDRARSDRRSRSVTQSTARGARVAAQAHYVISRSLNDALVPATDSLVPEYDQDYERNFHFAKLWPSRQGKTTARDELNRRQRRLPGSGRERSFI